MNDRPVDFSKAAQIFPPISGRIITRRKSFSSSTTVHSRSTGVSVYPSNRKYG